MNREMRRMMEREERRQKKDKTPTPTARAQTATATRPAPAVEKKPLPSRVRQYLHEVRVELKKVNWPSGEQMVRFTAVTVAVTIALTLIIFAMDVVMKDAVFRLLQWLGGGS